MTPQQQSAIEAVYGQALTQQQASDIGAWVDARSDSLVAAYLSQGRTRVASRIVSARRIAAEYPGGPLAAEAVLLKLEGARDTMLASTDSQQKLIGSLLRRHLAFLSGEGLDMGDPALRGMLDQFVTLGVLTADETQALKDIALVPNPIEVGTVSDALNAVGR